MQTCKYAFSVTGRYETGLCRHPTSSGTSKPRPAVRAPPSTAVQLRRPTAGKQPCGGQLSSLHCVMTVLVGLSGASKLVDRLVARTEVCDCQHPHATAEYGGQIIGWPADNNLGRQHVQCVVQDMVYTTGGDMEYQNRSSVTQRQMDPQIQQELALQSWRGVQAMASSLRNGRV